MLKIPSLKVVMNITVFGLESQKDYIWSNKVSGKKLFCTSLFPILPMWKYIHQPQAEKVVVCVDTLKGCLFSAGPIDLDFD